MEEQKALIVSGVQRLVDSGVLASEVFKKVGKRYNVTSNAVRNLYYRRRGQQRKKHGNCALTIQQEILLLGITLAFSACHLGFRPLQIIEVGTALWGLHLGKSTVYRFCKRHEEAISARKKKYLAKKRTDSNMVKYVAAFCASLDVGVENFKYMAKNVVNYDETRVVVGCDNQLVLERTDKNRPESRGMKPKSLGSLVMFICADGSVVMSVFILPCGEADEDGFVDVDFTVPSEDHSSRKSWPRFFMFSKSSYTNTELHGLIIEKFCDIWNQLYPGLHCFLFGDELACHYNPGIMKMALLHGVHSWMFPPCCSHFLQPLDDVCFAAFKRAISTMINKVQFRALLEGIAIHDELYKAVYQCEREVFTPRLIKRAFKNTGIFPYQPERIMELARQMRGITVHPPPIWSIELLT